MTSPSRIVRLPLVAMAAVLAALTIVALILASDSAFRSWGWWRLSFFAIPVVVAVFYLNEYRKLPYEPWHFFPPRPTPASAPAPPPVPSSPPSPPPVPATAPEVVAADVSPEPSEDEPFEDPVEEADRLAREAAQDDSHHQPDGP